MVRKKTGKRQKPEGEYQQLSLKKLSGFVFLLLITTASASGVIYSTHKSRFLINELQILERQRNTLQVEKGQLLLEQSSLVSQGRIENLAIAELGMVIPETERVVVVTGE